MRTELTSRVVFCISLLIGSILFFTSCRQAVNHQVTVPFYNTPDFTPVWEAYNPGKDTYHKVPRFSFVNQLGDPITEKNVENKIYLVNLFFTSCSGICPRMTETLMRVHDRFKKDTSVMIISHTVDPENDTPEQLLDFAERNTVLEPGWQFVTGDKDSIYTLARKGYFVEQVMGYNKDTNEFLHSENIILVDRHGHIRGIYNGTVLLDAGRMIDDIGKLKSER
jgi:protein SCO1